MLLSDVIPGQPVHHDIRESFGQLLEGALYGVKICVAHGPLYTDDPAAQVIAPFRTSARQTGWRIACEEQLAPPHVISLARHLRSKAARDEFVRVNERAPAIALLDEWTRAGLVLEVASRRGIMVAGRGLLHVRWRLCGTETGRFGAETIRGRDPNGASWSFNPLTIPESERHLLVPNGTGRRLVSIDFRAMDLWSMLAVVPGLAERYRETNDPHGTTARIIFERDPDDDERLIAKREIFVHAYGGRSPLQEHFNKKLPELDFLRALPHGEGARRVQRASAIAFRAALARALPLLIYDEMRPMIAVHDELVLDVAPGSEERVAEVTGAMEAGARHRIGQPYGTRVSFGVNYADCKR